MFGFLIKKAFFDMWDNMFRILIMNLGYILVFAIFFFLAPLFTGIPALFIAILVVGIAIFALYTGVVSKMCSEIADYKQPGFSDVPRFFKESCGSSLILALALAVYVFVVSVAFQFYGGLKSLAGPLAVALLFWVTVGWIFASQYFFPIQSRLDRKFRKILRKTFLVFFDNPGFSIGLFICHRDRSHPLDLHGTSPAGYFHGPPAVERGFQAAAVQVRLARAEPGGEQENHPLGRPAG